MSFEDYVHHMTQKYRVAVALAVLKGKPEELSIEQYIIHLQNKMKDKHMQIDSLDITVCSADFNFDNDTNFDINIENAINQRENGVMEVQNIDRQNIEELNHTEDLTNFDVIMKSTTIENESSKNEESDALTDVLRLLRDVDGYTEIEKSACNVVLKHQYFTQSTSCEESQIISYPATSKTNTNNTETYCDSNVYDNSHDENNTNIYNRESSKTTNRGIIVNGNEKLNKAVYYPTAPKTDSNNKHISTAASNIVLKHQDFTQSTSDSQIIFYPTTSKTNSIDEDYTYYDSRIYNNSHDGNNTNIDKRESFITTNKEIIVNFNENLKKPIGITSNEECDHSKKREFTDSKINESKNSEYIDNDDRVLVATNMKNNNTESNIKLALNNLYDTNSKDSQETLLYSLHGFTQTYTHVSQSQDNDIKIAEKFIIGNRKSNKHDNEVITDAETYMDTGPNNIHRNESIVVQNEEMLHQNISEMNKVTNMNSKGIQYVVDTHGRSYQVLLGKNNTGENDPTPEVNTPNAQDIFDEFTESQAEIIPFKVVEELNRIKGFLNRRVERYASADVYSIDSGYRSDSQSRSSYRSALHSSDSWLNESAHCLFNYVTQCHLVATTQEITNEISQVLGKLVDRLHEEEKYPQFLEDILEHIELLLHHIFQGDGTGENILQKDETIQRILLLNESLHILKFTIDKITCILETVHENLTNEDPLYELTNIDGIENASYIFHTLEIVLHRYLKVKRGASQNSTQPSQEEETLLKKSSITDIWRKKWNPNYKHDNLLDGTVEKKCVLTKCGDVLNKMVVECMGGYSLVAFAALQCFNLLQS